MSQSNNIYNAAPPETGGGGKQMKQIMAEIVATNAVAIRPTEIKLKWFLYRQ